MTRQNKRYRVRRRNTGVATGGRDFDKDIEASLLCNTGASDDGTKLVNESG